MKPMGFCRYMAIYKGIWPCRLSGPAELRDEHANWLIDLECTYICIGALYMHIDVCIYKKRAIQRSAVGAAGIIQRDL